MILSLIEIIVAIASSAICCAAVCCRSPPQSETVRTGYTASTSVCGTLSAVTIYNTVSVVLDVEYATRCFKNCFKLEVLFTVTIRDRNFEIGNNVCYGHIEVTKHNLGGTYDHYFKVKKGNS